MIFPVSIMTQDAIMKRARNSNITLDEANYQMIEIEKQLKEKFDDLYDRDIFLGTVIDDQSDGKEIVELINDLAIIRQIIRRRARI